MESLTILSSGLHKVSSRGLTDMDRAPRDPAIIVWTERGLTIEVFLNWGLHPCADAKYLN
jgi:hypothetical protein